MLQPLTIFFDLVVKPAKSLLYYIKIFRKHSQISYKNKCYWSQFSFLKGNLIKVTRITQHEAVSLV